MGKEIGIDFGTTNTVVSYVNKSGRIRALRYDKSEIIPSVIYFRTSEEYFIGSTAKKLLAQNPAAGVENFKTSIGDSQRHEISAESGEIISLRARDAAKLFLNKIVQGIESKLVKEFGAATGCIDRAVITVPANFSSTEKGAVKNAANDAGLENIKLAAEPTAAAVAYENSRGNDADEIILVYDFGGGTFDVSVIQKNHGAFEEITTGGDKHLGGNVMTKKIADKILAAVNLKFATDFPATEDDFDEELHKISDADYRMNMSEIWRTADLIKEDLSEDENAEEFFNIALPDGKSETFEFTLSRTELEELIGEEINRTVEITLKTIQAAKDKGVEKIERIVLAGGSSNIPLVKKTLEERLQSHDIVFSDDVSTLISRGATILAGRYAEMDKLTKPVTALQMGITAAEGMEFEKFQMLIPEDAPLPCTMKRTFYLSRDNQRRLVIDYYERDVKNYPAAKYGYDKGVEQIDSLVIDNLPPNLKAGEVKVDVTFTAQIDGSLDINVELKNLDDEKITQGNITFTKKSDIE